MPLTCDVINLTGGKLAFCSYGPSSIPTDFYSFFKSVKLFVTYKICEKEVVIDPFTKKHVSYKSFGIQYLVSSKKNSSFTRISVK